MLFSFPKRPLECFVPSSASSKAPLQMCAKGSPIFAKSLLAHSSRPHVCKSLPKCVAKDPLRRALQRVTKTLHCLQKRPLRAFCQRPTKKPGLVSQPSRVQKLFTKPPPPLPCPPDTRQCPRYLQNRLSSCSPTRLPPSPLSPTTCQVVYQRPAPLTEAPRRPQNRSLLQLAEDPRRHSPPSPPAQLFTEAPPPTGCAPPGDGRREVWWGDPPILRLRSRS